MTSAPSDRRSHDREAIVDAEPSGLTLLAPHVVSREARIAHDIKNSVSTIAAIAMLLERHVTGTARERAVRLRVESERLCHLVRAELDGIASGTSTHGAARFCLLDMAHAVIARATDSATRHDIRLHLRAEPLRFRGDRAALEEALFNLVCNGIEATPAGGVVAVAMRRTSEGDDEWTVRDTGRGIPSAQLAELGTPGSTRKRGGSGFGVAIARSVVAEHDGVLRVDSREGHGTTFTILIPAAADRGA